MDDLSGEENVLEDIVCSSPGFLPPPDENNSNPDLDASMYPDDDGVPDEDDKNDKDVTANDLEDDSASI